MYRSIIILNKSEDKDDLILGLLDDSKTIHSRAEESQDVYCHITPGFCKPL